MPEQALQKINYGVYIVSSRSGGKYNGQIANAVMQVAAEPATIAISINKQNLTHQFISESGVFTVSVLTTKATMQLIGLFGFKSGRDTDKFKDTKYKTGVTGAPLVLESTAAHIEAEVLSSLDAGTHTIFLGKVINHEAINPDEPMTYAYYHQVKKGLSPKSAPTYIKEDTTKESQKEAVTMKKYKCTVCGYIYDPAVGDPDSNIKPGTPFEKLPDNWVCPICGADKSVFEPV